MTGQAPGRDRPPVPLDPAALLSSVSTRVQRLRDTLFAVLDLAEAIRGLTEAGHVDGARIVAAWELPVPIGAPVPRGSAKFLARADAFLAAI